MREGGKTEQIELHDPQPGLLYNLEGVVHLTGVSRRSVLLYCKSGLVQARQDPEIGALAFDDEAIYTIRRVEYLRSHRGINLDGIRMILELMNEVRRLEHEMRFLRS
ncbi:MAG TPA: chaperone modulator CbpM [Candidatus Kapabacteria bacterium]|jgi:DNA-binding transcriptional MerR regulator|nr:chaperone modulator CbpM [Candidatus Kapabacteria bacterium]